MPKPRSRDPKDEHMRLGVMILSPNLEAQSSGGRVWVWSSRSCNGTSKLIPPAKRLGLRVAILDRNREAQTAWMCVFEVLASQFETFAFYVVLEFHHEPQISPCLGLQGPAGRQRPKKAIFKEYCYL